MNNLELIKLPVNFYSYNNNLTCVHQDDYLLRCIYNFVKNKINRPYEIIHLDELVNFNSIEELRDKVL